MNRTIPFAALLLAAGTLMAADSPKDDVVSAAKKLAASPNYSWETTVKVTSGRFRPGPTEGKTEKDGYTTIDLSFGDNSSHVVLKGTNGAVQGDGDWQSLADAAKDDGGGGFNPTRFLALRMQTFKNPAEEAEHFAGMTKNLTLADGVYSGDLTDDAIKERFNFGPPGGGPEITDTKGEIKFWVTDGLLSKYEIHAKAHIDFNGNGGDRDSVTTIEIKDVGKTKVTVPDDAKKKM